MFTRTLAAAAITAVLAAAPSSCSHTPAAPAAQSCNPPANAKLIAYTNPAPTETLYVNACAADLTNNKFDLVHIPIRIEYTIATTDPTDNPKMVKGPFALNNMHVTATTTYTHPIGFPTNLPFVLTATFTYVGRNAKDIGTVLECWHEVGRNTADYERTEIQRVTITHNNYTITGGPGSATVSCGFVNPHR